MTAASRRDGALPWARALPMRLARATGLTALCVAASLLLNTTGAAAAESLPNRIKPEYYPPKNPAHQPIFDLLKEKRALEKLQEIFSPLRLPIELKLQIGPCGVANAWYNRDRNSPASQRLLRVSGADHEDAAQRGCSDGGLAERCPNGPVLLCYAHELGHAAFDLLQLPVFGNEEDAADQFATYITLQFGKDDARRLITGAAFAYERCSKPGSECAPHSVLRCSRSPGSALLQYALPLLRRT